MGSLDHWRRRPRENSGPFDPGPMEGKPSMKSLELEITRQVKALHSTVNRDLDLLHEQVHNEVYTALSQELVSVAQNLTAIRMEASNSVEACRVSGGALEQNVGALTTVIERMRGELNNGLNIAKASAEGVREVKAGLQELQDKDLKQIREGVEASLARAEATLQKEIAGLRAETAEIASPQPQEPSHIPEEFVARVAELEAKLPQVELAASEALSAEAGERATRTGELAMSVEVSRAEARQLAEQLEASIRTVTAEAEARERQAEQAILANIEKRLDLKSDSVSADILAETNARATTAAEEVAERCKALDGRVVTLVLEVESQFKDARRDIRQLTSECQEGLRFAHNCWTRTIDWMASVDLAELEKAGRFDVESPEFTAAGLRSLQLCLRLIAVEKSNGRMRWTCGAFLRGSVGQVSFRLQVAGKTQSFAGDFANTPEWGSQKIVTLESVGPSVPVRLEILDVTALIPAQLGAPIELTPTFQMTDAARVATREADKVRSMMVKRIEWRVVHISERIAAARAAAASGQAEREALEPLLSPPFSAGGVEGLQLQLYPLGYLRRDDAMPSSNYEEKCGFFLVCPRGSYMKCRAFVGDQVKIFEHQYTDREPFGRPNFCRLIDKAGQDDCVVCGIEILDVRQEHTTQVKGGPFGSIVDQMKVTLAPSLGNMEVMREIRDAADRGVVHAGGGPGGYSGDRGGRGGRHRQPAAQGSEAYPGASYVAAALAPLGPSMLLSNVQSLPALLPEGAGAKAKAAASGSQHGHSHSQGRQSSWPPSPVSPAKQKMRLPKI